MITATRAGVMLFLAASIPLLVAAPVRAQETATSFDDLRRVVTPGETIFVTDTSGMTVKGRLVQVEGSSLEIRIPREEAPRRFLQRDVNNIVAERGDSWWNGMLIGFASGAVPGVLMELGSASKFDAHAPIGLGAVGLLTGLLIDVLNKENVTVFVHAPVQQSRGVSVRPLVRESAVGIQMAVRF